ncbi:hypothetical protein SDC9_81231 [bioreactor metagenome]|uniref:Right handed beta helix domain-containing protein n=1 Tax=bioreactor metagenome TaxID=1076179 RepID=A0A644Z9L4_9ZZZZ|nr:hypothetical protein [Oscillospiraceae bacterium]
MKTKRLSTRLLISVILILTLIFSVSCGDQQNPIKSTNNMTETTGYPETTAEVKTDMSETKTGSVTTEPLTTTESETKTEPITTEESATETNAPTETKAKLIEISSADELRAFAKAANSGSENYADYVISITADIDLSSENWVPFSTDYMEYATIEGNNHTISGITIVGAEAEQQLGFIKTNSKPLYIQNITFKNIKITASERHAAAVIGQNNSEAIMDNVNVDTLTVAGGTGKVGDLTGICFRIGGLVGMASSASTTVIKNCSVKNIDLTGFHNLAALIGADQSDKAVVENNTVSNIKLNYSAGYSENYDAAKARTFCDIFYNNTTWSDHRDYDKDNGNTYENVTFYDIAYDVTYKDLEGR